MHGHGPDWRQVGKAGAQPRSREGICNVHGSGVPPAKLTCPQSPPRTKPAQEAPGPLPQSRVSEGCGWSEGDPHVTCQQHPARRACLCPWRFPPPHASPTPVLSAGQTLLWTVMTQSRTRSLPAPWQTLRWVGNAQEPKHFEEENGSPAPPARHQQAQDMCVPPGLGPNYRAPCARWEMSKV